MDLSQQRIDTAHAKAEAIVARGEAAIHREENRRQSNRLQQIGRRSGTLLSRSGILGDDEEKNVAVIRGNG